MRRLCVKRQLASLLISFMALGAFSLSGAVAQEAPEDDPQAAPAAAFVDGIAAVVNQNVITLRQLDLENHKAFAAEGDLSTTQVKLEHATESLIV